MPLYDYRCLACGVEFEARHAISADPPDCAECGTPEPKKLVSGGNFVLKGGGWYADGYSRKGASPAGGKTRD